MLGQRFGRLVVVGEADKRSGQRLWNCVCDCGKKAVVWQTALKRSGPSRSCGCAVPALRSKRWAEYREPAFWARVDTSEPDGCWNWTGHQVLGPKNTSPYGVLGWNGRQQRAHRVAYLLKVGPIPTGAMVLHRCDNSLCCNPAHLYIGDHAQNMQDMVDRRRRVGKGAGERNGRAKLTQAQADEIRVMYAAGGVSQQRIADLYGISQFAVSQIVLGKRYVTNEI